ncbi:MAG: T9SS C-terminal target domain-containing protein [Calditrichaeota bacterium]|nr:MAG: T9SS C-terminal target domain-containing protein [Calditrichota bacterium]
MKHLKSLSILSFVLVWMVTSPSQGQQPKSTSEDVADGPFLRGYLETPEGSEVCNPCVENAIEALNTLNSRGQSLGFNWGADYPTVAGAGTQNHWQGIQRLPARGLDFPYLVVCSSHRDFILSGGEIEQISGPARFAIVELASRSATTGRLRSNRLRFGKLTREVRPADKDRIVLGQIISREYDHPGGMQMVGSYLLVGTDGNIGHDRNTALFTLWDLSNPLEPRQVWDPRWELPGRNANSVGITRLADGNYLMVRALGDAKELEFYILDSDLETSPASYHDGTPWDRWRHKELRSELLKPDGSLDLKWADLGGIFGDAGYQNTSIVTECGTGKLYLVASHGRRPGGLGGSDFVDLYRLDVPVEHPDPDADNTGVIITKVAHRQLFPGQNAGTRQGDLQAAAGTYISPDHKLYFYATEHGATGEGRFVTMIEFAPEVPRERAHTLDEAYVELFSEPNFDGRSIFLDYVDRRLRDYHDFGNIEEFDDLAASAIFAIPPGAELRVFAERNESGAYLDLVGTGQAVRIADFDSLLMSDGQTASHRISSAKWIEQGPVTAAATSDNIPFFFELYQNYPNPFNPETIIDYRLDRPADVKIEIYDIRGHLVKTLVDQRQPAGSYSVKWNGKDDLGQDVASGTYLCQLKSGELVKVRQLTLLR